MMNRFGWYKSDTQGQTLKIENITDEQAKLILSYAAETRRFEIERFWQRSLFFWGMVAAALVGYGALKDDKTGQFFIGCFGIITSVAWTLQNRGAKYWQESWERKVVAIQSKVLGTNLFSNKEPIDRKGWFGASRFSVSTITIILSDAAAFTFFGLTTRLVRFSHPYTANGEVSMALLLTGGTVLLLLFAGRSKADRS